MPGRPRRPRRAAVNFLSERFEITPTQRTEPVSTPLFDFHGTCPKPDDRHWNVAISEQRRQEHQHPWEFDRHRWNVLGSVLAVSRPGAGFPSGAQLLLLGQRTPSTPTSTGPTASRSPCWSGAGAGLCWPTSCSGSRCTWSPSRRRSDCWPRRWRRHPPETKPGVCPEGSWTLDLEATDYVRVPGVTASGSIVLAVGRDGLWSTSGSLHFEGGGAPPSDVPGDGSGPWTRGTSDVVTFDGTFRGRCRRRLHHRVLW